MIDPMEVLFVIALLYVFGWIVSSLAPFVAFFIVVYLHVKRLK